MNALQFFDWGSGVAVIKYAIYFSGIEEAINALNYLDIKYKNTGSCGGIGFIREGANDPNHIHTSAIVKKVDKNIFEIIYLFKPEKCTTHFFESKKEILLNVESIGVVFDNYLLIKNKYIIDNDRGGLKTDFHNILVNESNFELLKNIEINKKKYEIVYKLKFKKK